MLRRHTLHSKVCLRNICFINYTIRADLALIFEQNQVRHQNIRKKTRTTESSEIEKLRTCYFFTCTLAESDDTKEETN
jgi:hypothetical protein